MTDKMKTALKRIRLICICCLVAVCGAAMTAVTVLLAGCDVENNDAVISVTVNGETQKSGEAYDALTYTEYTVVASSSDGLSVKASYVFGSSEAQDFAGKQFTPEEEGEYIFTFSAENAENFVLTFNVKENPVSGTRYTVSFYLGEHAAQGTETPADKKVLNGDNFILPAQPAATDGYSFVGWYDGNVIYGTGTQYTVTSDVSFTAVWSGHGTTVITPAPVKYTVNFSLGNTGAAAGSVAPASKKVEVNGSITLPAKPAAASGYSFVGWSDGQKTYAHGESYVVKGNVTLTALWHKNSSAPAVNTIENGDFERGDLTGWTYSEGTGNGQILGAKAVSDQTDFFDEKIPFNQGGTYFFNGWKAKEEETQTYSLKSTAFVLGGSGYISFKMAGRAACVKVYDSNEDVQIAEYKNSAFSDGDNFMNLDEGRRLATLTTFAADLSAHLGESLYIELCDIAVDGNWGVAFFDDIVTYYATAPNVSANYDTVYFYKGGYAEGKELTEYHMPWAAASNTYVNLEIIGQNVLSLSFEGTGFEELNTNGSGNTSVINGVLNNPIFQNAPVQPYRPAGVKNKALSFDGYSQYLSYTGGVNGRELTIDVYVCPRAYAWSAPQDTPDKHAAQVIVGSYDSGAKKGFMLGITKFGYPTFRVGTGEDWYILSFPTNSAQYRLPNYEWSRLTAVFDSKQKKMCLYINGALAGTQSVKKNAQIVSAEKEILVGAASEPAYEARFEITKFNGLMDELSVVSEVTSAEVIAQSGTVLPAISYDVARMPDYLLENDWYRPQYHAVPPANWMNEPHTLFHYNNKWHLFYQYNPVGPYWRNICWGHWVSNDMVQWESVKEAVIPTEGSITPDGVWTGNVVFDNQGHPMLLITAGDDSRPHNGSNQHVGLVRAKDYSDPYLTEWIIGDFAVKQTAEMGTPGEFRDAQAFGIGNDRYMVVGGAKDGKGMAHAFKTTADKLNDWQYMGSLYDPADYKDYYGKVWEMPNLVPLPNEDGTPSGKYMFLFSPQHGKINILYYIGDFNTATCKFTPDASFGGVAKVMDFGEEVFTGPTVYLDNDTRKVYICSIMQDKRSEEDHYNASWAFMAGLPRELFLRSDGTIGIKNIDTSSAQGAQIVSFSGKSVSEANNLLGSVNSDLVKIDFEIKNAQGECGLRLKNGADGYAKLYFTNDRAGIDTNTVNNVYQRRRGDFSGDYTRGGTVKGTIYIDKCLIEVYFDNAATISECCYSRSGGLQVFGNAEFSITVTAMNSIH